MTDECLDDVCPLSGKIRQADGEPVRRSGARSPRPRGSKEMRQPCLTCLRVSSLWFRGLLAKRLGARSPRDPKVNTPALLKNARANPPPLVV